MENNSSKRDGPSPSPARSPKRSKQPDNETSHLPAEMWAAVMEYLEFSSVISMTATSRTMRDAVPYVTELHIYKSCQMHVSVARRFTDVKRVFIHHLVRQVTDDDDEEEDSDDEVDTANYIVDFDTAMRAVPFISTFANIEKCCFGSIDGTYDHYDNIHGQSKRYLQSLIDNISFGFQCGTLSPLLEVTGLFCGSRMRTACESCVRACRSFPVKAVSRFVHDEASTHNLKVCIKREALANILKARPGGEEALCSPYHLFRQLGKCGRLWLGSQNGKKLWLVIVAACNEAVLEYELNQSGLDKAKLDSSQVSAAITKSFRIKPTDFHILSDHLGRSFANFGLEVCDEVFVPKSRRQDIAREFLPSIRKNDLSVLLLLQHSPSLVEDGLIHDDKLFVSVVIPKLMQQLVNLPGPDSPCHLRILSKLTNTITNVATWDDIMPKDFFSQPNIAGNDASAAINNKTTTIKEMVDANTINGELQNIVLDNTICLSCPTFYQMQFNQRYGFYMAYLGGRAVVKNPWESGTKAGAIIIAINSHVLKREPFSEIRRRMSSAIQSSASVVLTFIEDSEFTELFAKEILSRFEKLEQLASQKDTDH